MATPEELKNNAQPWQQALADKDFPPITPAEPVETESVDLDKTSAAGSLQQSPVESGRVFQPTLDDALRETFATFGEGFEPAGNFADTATRVVNALKGYFRDDEKPVSISEIECRIGGSRFFVPPISINVSQQFKAGAIQGTALRQNSSPKFNTGHTETVITMTIYFPEKESVIGYSGDVLEIDFDKGPADKIDSFLSSLRGLIAEFKYAPFLPIRNVYLNQTFGITGVVLQSMTLSTVEDYPFAIAANLTLLKFNHKPYMPMIEDFEQAIHWGKFRQYMGRAVRKLASQIKPFIIWQPSDQLNGTTSLGTLKPSLRTASAILADVPIEKMSELATFNDPSLKINPSYLEFYYPFHTPARMDLPDLADLKNYDINKTQKAKDWWEKLIGLLGVDVNTYPQANLSRVESTAKELGYISKATNQFKILANWLKSENLTSEIMGPTQLERYISQRMTEDGIKSGTGAADQFRNEITDVWFYAMYRSFQEDTVFAKALASQDFRRNSLVIQEWDIPMLKLGLDLNSAVIQGISVTIGNTVARLQNQMQDEPTHQHIGGDDTRIDISIKVLGEQELLKLKNMFSSINGLARIEHGHGVLGFLGIENTLTSMCGVKYCIPLSFEVDTIPGYPHSYDVRITLTDFDVFQQKREMLTSEQQAELITAFGKRNPFFRIKQLWGAFNAYPDFPLDVRDNDGKIVGHLDPDFYFRSFHTVDDDIIDPKPAVNPDAKDPRLTPNYNFVQDDGVHICFGRSPTSPEEGEWCTISRNSITLWSNKEAKVLDQKFDEPHAGNMITKPYVEGLTPPSGYVAPFLDGNDPTGQYDAMMKDLRYRDKGGRMIRAFPTFMLWLIDEGGTFAGIKMFDNFYGLQAVLDFSIVNSEDILGDTLVLRVSNLYSRLSTKFKDYLDEDIYKNAKIINQQTTAFHRVLSGLSDYLVQLDTIDIRPGVRVHMRMGYCADDQTQILTKNGWKTHDQLRENDIVLTLNHETGISEWQPVLKVNKFEVVDEEMVSIEGKFHSSLTTLNHRWPVLHAVADQKNDKVTYRQERRWKTSGTIKTNDKFITSALCNDIPKEPVYSDAFVELVAWYWTEGSQSQVEGREYPSIRISQSHIANPIYVTRIRNALTHLYGPAAETLGIGTRWGRNEIPLWREDKRPKKTETLFRLNIRAGIPLDRVAPNRIVSLDFIKALTLSQLELFIQISLWADRNQERSSGSTLSQKNRNSLEALEYAAILTGRSTHLYQNPYVSYDRKGNSYHMQTLNMSNRSTIGFTEIKPQRTYYSGTIWCPTTQNRSWFARRRGTTYFTGNSANPNSLDTVFNGVITEVQQGEVMTITAQSDAIELSAMVNGADKSGSSGKIDGSMFGLYMSEPRDLMITLLTRGSSVAKEVIAHASKGVVFSENRYGIKHFGSILYQPLSKKEEDLNKARAGKIKDRTDVLKSGDANATRSIVSFQNMGISDIIGTLWSNFAAKQDYEIFKRNIYPGNGTGVAQYMGGDVGDVGLTDAIGSTGVNSDGTFMNDPLTGQPYQAPDPQTMLASALQAIEPKEEENVNKAPTKEQIFSGGASGSVLGAAGGPGGALLAGFAGSGLGVTKQAHNFLTKLGIVSPSEDDGPFDEVSFRAQTYTKSVWDLFKVCAGLLPDYIVAVRPFEDRSTIFYGKPHWLYSSGLIPLTTGNPHPPPLVNPDEEWLKIYAQIEQKLAEKDNVNVFEEFYDSLSNVSSVKSITPSDPNASTEGLHWDPTSNGSVLGQPTYFDGPKGRVTLPATIGIAGQEMHIPTDPDLTKDANQHKQLDALPPQERHPFYMDRYKVVNGKIVDQGGVGGGKRDKDQNAKYDPKGAVKKGDDGSWPGANPGGLGGAYLTPESEQYYMNMRWNPVVGWYSHWKDARILVYNDVTKKGVVCTPGDWGPGVQTKVAGLSPDAYLVLGTPITPCIFRVLPKDTPLGPVDFSPKRNSTLVEDKAANTIASQFGENKKDLLPQDTISSAPPVTTTVEQKSIPSWAKGNANIAKFAYDNGYKLEGIPVDFSEAGIVDEAGSKAFLIYQNTSRKGEDDEIWNEVRKYFRTDKQVASAFRSSKYITQLPADIKDRAQKEVLNKLADEFLRFLWQNPFARGWVVKAVNKRIDKKESASWLAGAAGGLIGVAVASVIDASNVLDQDRKWDLAPLYSAFTVFIQDGSNATAEYLKHHLQEGRDQENVLMRGIEEVGAAIKSNILDPIGQIAGAVSTAATGLLNFMRLSLAQLSHGLSMASNMQQQTNMLNRIFNDSIYYQLGTKDGKVVNPLLHLADNPFTREYGEPVVEIRQPFQRVHTIGSFTEILNNGMIESSDQVATVVTATSNGNHPVTVHFDKGAPSELQREKTIETGLFWDHPKGWFGLKKVLHPIQTSRYFMQSTGQGWAKDAISDETSSKRIALYHLKESLKDIYTGEITILGDPSIRAHDLVYIGDVYECQPPETVISVVRQSGTRLQDSIIQQIPIEDVREGDNVISLGKDGAYIRMRGSRVVGISSRLYDGDLIRIKTDSGKCSEYTPNHRCIVRFGDAFKDKWIVYLMEKAGNYRIGMTKGISATTRTFGEENTLGLVLRMRGERADKGWILSIHETMAEAMKHETITSFKYGIPQTCFVANNTRLTQEQIDEIWKELGDNVARAHKCLLGHGADIQYPFRTLGQMSSTKKRSEVYAQNLFDGMLMKNMEGGWESVKVSQVPYQGLVYSLDVEGDETYLADGLFTHNSIYGFFEVEQVVHHFTPETGFITAITPNACVTINDPARFSALSFWAGQNHIQQMRNHVRHVLKAEFDNEPTDFHGEIMSVDDMVDKLEDQLKGSLQYTGGGTAVIKSIVSTIAGGGATSARVAEIAAFSEVGTVGNPLLAPFALAGKAAWGAWSWVRDNLLDQHGCYIQYLTHNGRPMDGGLSYNQGVAVGQMFAYGIIAKSLKIGELSILGPDGNPRIRTQDVIKALQWTERGPNDAAAQVDMFVDEQNALVRKESGRGTDGFIGIPNEIYWVKIYDVIDGDTFKSDVLGQYRDGKLEDSSINLGKGDKIRLAAVDSPEDPWKLDPSVAAYHFDHEGVRATTYARNALSGREVALRVVPNNRIDNPVFGRVLAYVFSNAPDGVTGEDAKNFMLNAAAGFPEISWDAFTEDGKPYTFNWQLVITGHADVFTKDMKASLPGEGVVGGG